MIETENEQAGRDAELDEALSAATAEVQRLQGELAQCKRDYKAAAQRGDGEAMARAWRRSLELPHVLHGAQIRAVQCQLATLEAQVPAAERAAQEAAARLEDAARRLPFGGRLLIDSPVHQQQHMAQLKAEYHRAQQQHRGLQARVAEVRNELTRVLLKANIDF
jgi:chromosome segregation ATPase